MDWKCYIISVICVSLIFTAEWSSFLFLDQVIYISSSENCLFISFNKFLKFFLIVGLFKNYFLKVLYAG